MFASVHRPVLHVYADFAFCRHYFLLMCCITCKNRPMNLEPSVKPKSVFAILAAAVLLVLGAASAFVGYTLYQSHARYVVEAEQTSRNLAMALEHALGAHFKEVDLALQRAQVEFRALHAEGRFTPERFSAYLRTLKERIPQAQSVRGTDANGMVVYGEAIDPAKVQDMTIREFWPRVRSERELVFGVPVKSRISGDVVFPLLRAMTLTDGSFVGTAYVNMDIARISDLIASLDLGKHGVFTLVDTGQRLLYRYPDVARPDDGKPIKMQSETAALLAAGSQRGTISATSQFDGQKRRVSLERIGDYPVYIVVGLAESDFLVPWEQEVRNALVFLALLFVLAGSLLFGVHLSLRRQRRALEALVDKDRVLQSLLAALTQSEARFRSLTEGLPQMVFTIAGDFRFDFISHHWHEYTGLDRQALADPAALARIVHPDDLAAMRAAWQTAFEGGGQFRCECRLRRHDGAWRMFDNHGLPQRGEGAAIVCWVGSSADVSDQRDATLALSLAKDQALAAGRAKSDFVANMSHEIRSPMNAVSGMLQLLQRTPLTSVQRDYALKAETSARALLGILNDILDFSKVEEGKLALDPQPFSFDKLLRELAVILSANASGKDVEVLFNISPDIPRWLLGDELRLQQVLLNLAGNAIKFTEQGEVVLTVLPVRADADGVELAVIVRDSGIGIAADQLDRIFDGFSQAEASTARRFGGTGLGLAISQRLVALMGGELRVASNVGLGSVFDFTIRLQRAAQADERHDSHQLQRLHCLVVDDNASGREVLAAMVRSFGWSADIVDGGYEALAAVTESAALRPYDVVLMDWRMPGLDGWETSRQLRLRLKDGPLPLIVMVTAHDRQLVTEMQSELPEAIDAMLAKPVTASVLFETIGGLKLGARQPAPGVPAFTGGRLHGLRLLVVDDNALNQQVARELLRADGAEVDVADSGRAGIDAVSADPQAYDLVLMDIQMPDMDGYATTAAILAHLGAKAPPIVAITANAMASDRAAALAGGMVDHVGKPFELEQLVDVILRHARGGAAPAAAAPVLVSQQLAQLDSGKALARLGGNAEVYHLAIGKFSGEMDKLLAQLVLALGNPRAEPAAPALHVMKGLAGMVGADSLAALAHEAEQSSLADPLSTASAALLAKVMREAGAAMRAIADVKLPR